MSSKLYTYFYYCYTDAEEPVLICPEDVSLNAEPGKSYGTLATALDSPSVTDNSGVEFIQHELINPVTDGQYPIGETTVTYTVTDDSGNTASCSFVVIVLGKRCVDLLP